MQDVRISLGKNSAVGTAEGHLEVALHAPVTPYGDMAVEGYFCEYQSDAVYGLNSDENVPTTSLSGSATASGGFFSVSSGTTPGGAGSIQSRKRLRSRGGQGGAIIGSGYFSTPTAYGVQVLGGGTGETTLAFGFNGTRFGILHSTGGAREIQTLTITTASTASNNIQITLADTVYTCTGITSGSAVLTAKQIADNTFAGWFAQQRGSTVIFLAAASGNKTGVFSIGQSGAGVPAAGTFVETRAGVATNDTWYYQDDLITGWNGDRLDGTGHSGVTLNPLKINTYEIDTQYTGGAAIEFKICVAQAEGNNTEFVTVHRLNTQNIRTTPALSQPSFPFLMAAYITGGSTSVSVFCDSYAGFLSGTKKIRGIRGAPSATSTSVGPTNYQSVLTVRNNRVYNGIANQGVINILAYGCAHSDSTPLIVYLIKNATLSSTANFAAWSTNSCADIDTSSTTCTFTNNEQVISTMSLGNGAGQILPLSDEVTLQPGETITIAAKTVTGTAPYTTVNINMREDH